MKNAQELYDFLRELQNNYKYNLSKIDLIIWSGEDNHSIDNFELDTINKEEIIFSNVQMIKRNTETKKD